MGLTHSAPNAMIIHYIPISVKLNLVVGGQCWRELGTLFASIILKVLLVIVASVVGFFSINCCDKIFIIYFFWSRAFLKHKNIMDFTPNGNWACRTALMKPKHQNVTTVWNKASINKLMLFMNLFLFPFSMAVFISTVALQKEGRPTFCHSAKTRILG